MSITIFPMGKASTGSGVRPCPRNKGVTGGSANLYSGTPAPAPVFNWARRRRPASASQ